MDTIKELNNKYHVIYSTDGLGSLILEKKELSVFHFMERAFPESKVLNLEEAIEAHKTKGLPITFNYLPDCGFYEEITSLCDTLNRF